MKQLLLLVFSIFLATFVWAQVPFQVNYQGIARSTNGNALTSQNIGLRLSIHDGSALGLTVYQETRSLKTDRFGMFVVAIGSPGAINVVNSISSIDWSVGGDKFLQVELSPKNDNSFIDMGAAQLLSVPYALLAKSANPIGLAGGDLTGTYPNPAIANGVIFTPKLADFSVTTVKIKDSAVTTAKLLDGSVTASKIADGSVTLSKLATITAGGDLSGTFPNPVIRNGVVSTSKLADSSVTTAKIKDSSITLSKLAPGIKIGATGAAGGDLSGTYPNPAIAANAVTTGKIVDYAVTTSKIADHSLTLSKFTPINAAGDLSGLYPNPSIANNAVTTSKLLDSAVTTAKIKDGSVTTSKIADNSITLSKLAGNIVFGGSSPTGSAGGSLSGTYPNPGIANNAINTVNILDGAITTSKIADNSITSSKLGVLPFGGDLGGVYPNATVVKLSGIAISNLAPVSGQVLKFNGTQWLPGLDSVGALSIPFTSTTNSGSSLFSITNQGSGTSIQGINSIANTNAFGILGKITSLTPGTTSSAVRGINNGTGANGYGIWGSHDGTGSGVYGSSVNGMGINGSSPGGYGVYASSSTGTGIFATSDQGTAANFDISNTSSFNDALFTTNEGYGNGLTSIATLGNGVLGIGNDAGGTGVLGINNAGGEGVLGYTISDYASGIVGRNDGTYAGVRGFNTANNGTGVLAIANSNGAINGNALVAELEGSAVGNTAVFMANGSNVARIDNTGKGFFNGGTQMGGADVAEFFDVEGNYSDYEPGDVLAVSESKDRTVEKSSSAYSTLVLGVYATKPGLLLTEKNAERNSPERMVPMGVIGVIPTKVCLEGGVINRGDLLVTSSIPGVAMKGDPKKVQVGQVLGKALQSYKENGIAKINVLVSVK